MTPESLDPKHEKMIAALYGELSEDEEREFMASLSTDEALRAQWEELQAVRSFLKRAEVQDPTPSFVYVPPSEPLERFAAGNDAAGNAHRRPWARLRGLLRSPATGFALATTALVILLLAGLRVDRMADGVVVRFGPPPEPAPARVQIATGDLPPGVPLEPAADTRRGQVNGSSGYRVTQASNAEAYVTRAELAAYMRRLVQMTEARLSEREQRYSGQMAFMARGLSDAMAERQQRDRNELNAQIEQVWMSLVGMEGWRAEQHGFRLQPGSQYRLTPVHQSPTKMKEEEQHD